MTASLRFFIIGFLFVTQGCSQTNTGSGSLSSQSAHQERTPKQGELAFRVVGSESQCQDAVKLRELVINSIEKMCTRLNRSQYIDNRDGMCAAAVSSRIAQPSEISAGVSQSIPIGQESVRSSDRVVEVRLSMPLGSTGNAQKWVSPAKSPAVSLLTEKMQAECTQGAGQALSQSASGTSGKCYSSADAEKINSITVSEVRKTCIAQNKRLGTAGCADQNQCFQSFTTNPSQTGTLTVGAGADLNGGFRFTVQFQFSLGRDPSEPSSGLFCTDADKTVAAVKASQAFALQMQKLNVPPCSAGPDKSQDLKPLKIEESSVELPEVSETQSP